MKRFLLTSLCLAACAAVARADEGENQDKAKSLDEKFEELRKALPFDMHGGAYLWHYQPFVNGGKADTSLYYAWLSLDAKFDDFGFYFEPHFRDNKLRPFFNSDFWVQEIYASWKVPYGIGTLKAGKEYSRLGRFWDGSFYGNLPYFDGLKLDPDLGLSLENTAKLGDTLSLEYSAQYFTNDGRTNGSLADAALLQPRDTIGDGASRQHNSFVGRVAPTLKLSDDLSVTLGLSGESFQADFVTNNENQRVNRGDLEGAVRWGGLEIFAEMCWQSGHHVLNYPVAGAPSDHNHYIMAGAIYTLDSFTFRYNYSSADYDNRVREQFHMPAVVWAAHKHLSLWLEYVYWRQQVPGKDSFMDRSLNFVVDVHF
jgi:hypothetical protein